MTSILTNGKYRQRKDWSTNSIPALVSLEEEVCGGNVEISSSTNNNALPPKPPRRSSLAIGLLAGRGDKFNKRRSSIGVSFLGRRDSSSKTNKETSSTYETAVRTEKSDGSSNSPDIIYTHSSDTFNSSYDDDENGGGGGGGGGNGLTINNEHRIRRSSWQTKLERRKRRNLDTSPGFLEVLQQNNLDDEDALKKYENDGIVYNRQKRHSWWNIFIPDQRKQRSRRASQDVGIMSRSADSIASPRRSKSRSVDHGLATPFDLDSLRSKVEGRFESVDRLTKDGEKKKTSLPTIPTKTYTVGNRDTLTSVAARFDTTPSELTQLNRLNSNFIYPGQQLLVPDKTAKDGGSSSGSNTDEKIEEVPEKSSPEAERKSNEEILTEEKDILDGLRPGSPKPGHIERVATPKNADPADDPIITQRFLKINVRHITDGQGVVGGVLLVTPNAVMFDPNVSDPLVIEHGPESYGVIAPMELVVNAAIFHDIAHMRVAGGESNSNEKVEIYYPKTYSRCESSHSPGKDSLLVKDETFPELGLGSVETCDDQESICSSNGREGDAFPKAFERERVTPTNLQQKAQSGVPPENEKSVTEGTEKEAKDSTKTEDVTKNTVKNEDEEKKSAQTDTRSLEERRKSLLDHHWAIPSKERSSDDECENESNVIITDKNVLPPSLRGGSGGSSQNKSIDEECQLSKQTCYDSGIDINDPNALPILQPISSKKIYSDADIVLSSDWVPPRTISPTLVSESPPKNQAVHSNLLQTQSLDATGGRKKTSSVSFSVDDNEQNQISQTSDKTNEQNKKNKMLKRLSYPLTWVEGLTGEVGKSSDSDSAPNTGDSNQSVFSKVFSSSPITLVSELGGNLFLSKTPSEDSGGSPVPPVTPHSEGHSTPGRSSIGTFMRPHSSEGSHPTTQKPSKSSQPKLDYRSMVSIDDMPELFVSFDKLIPRPARACQDPPLYLRLRMGRPIGKAIPLPTSVMSYGKNKLRPEYWFSVPKNRTDELYRFIHTWVPHLYGELNEEQIKSRGFELIQHDTEWTKGSPSKDGRRNSEDGEDITELTRESWEVLSMSTDDYRKASLFATGSFDLDFPIPDLIGQTEILTEEHREKLCGHLPARAEGYSWSLVFSTSQNGFSLNSLYRKMQKLESPILIVIEDTEHNVFGALTSCSLHVSDLFYGTGESLLYKFNPNFKVFHWTGENLYFIKGNPESLSIGAGDGKFGLWLDGDLNQGRSQQCSTYANEPLAPQEDFVIKTLECWAFV